jgi:aspartate/methionine/tyrosine aminotransferase
MQGGFFVWMSLKQPLQIDTFEREREMYNGIFDKAKIVLVPGESCKYHEPGWYRVCFSPHPPEAMHDFIARLKHFIDQYKGRNEKQNWGTQNFMLPVGFGSKRS